MPEMIWIQLDTIDINIRTVHSRKINKQYPSVFLDSVKNNKSTPIGSKSFGLLFKALQKRTEKTYLLKNRRILKEFKEDDWDALKVLEKLKDRTDTKKLATLTLIKVKNHKIYVLDDLIKTPVN